MSGILMLYKSKSGIIVEETWVGTRHQWQLEHGTYDFSTPDKDTFTHTRRSPPSTHTPYLNTKNPTLTRKMFFTP